MENNYAAAPRLAVEEHSQNAVLTLQGLWGGRQLGAAELLLNKTIINSQTITLRLQEAQIDSNGALLLVSYFAGYNCDIQATPEALTLIDSVKNFNLSPPQPITANPWYILTLQALGRFTMQSLTLAKSLLSFLGEIASILAHSMIRLRLKAIFHHLEDFGLKALPIVGLISVLIGMVLTYQGINQLSRFGAEIFTVDFLGIGVLREIGVLLTSIVVAGRSGSAMAAQIGTMKLNQEIDALQVIGLNHVQVLVIPRLMAMLIALPMLVFFSDIFALLGGMVTMEGVVGLAPSEFWSQLQKAANPTHFWVGMSKAPLFAMVIVMVGCFRGFKVTGSAASVGAMTTRAVVEAIFLVIVCDAVTSVLYSYLRI